MINSEKNINKYNKTLPNNNYSDNKEIFSIENEENEKEKNENEENDFKIIDDKE